MRNTPTALLSLLLLTVVPSLVAGQACVTLQEANSGAVVALAYTTDGKTLVCGQEAGVTIHDLSTGQRRSLATSFLFNSPLVSLTLSPDGQLLLGKRNNGQWKCGDVATGRERRVPIIQPYSSALA